MYITSYKYTVFLQKAKYFAKKKAKILFKSNTYILFNFFYKSLIKILAFIPDKTAEEYKHSTEYVYNNMYIII